MPTQAERLGRPSGTWIPCYQRWSAGL